jgi:hypothetical protein
VVAFGLGFASWNVERSELVLRQMAKPHGVVTKSLDAENVIEICGDRIAQLFHTLDPFPFRDRGIYRRLGSGNARQSSVQDRCSLS